MLKNTIFIFLMVLLYSCDSNKRLTDCESNDCVSSFFHADFYWHDLVEKQSVSIFHERFSKDFKEGVLDSIYYKENVIHVNFHNSNLNKKTAVLEYTKDNMIRRGNIWGQDYIDLGDPNLIGGSKKYRVFP